MTDNDTDISPDPIEPLEPQKPVRRSVLKDIALDKILEEEAKKPSDKPKKKDLEAKVVKYGFIGGLVLILGMMVYSCQPAKGSMAYAICSTFLELNTPYPHTLRYVSLEESRTAARIYYTNIDPFGEYKLEMIECKFGPDQQMGMRITEIMRNRKAVDADIVNAFNKTLPTIMASDPYRIAPPEWKNQLLEN